MSIQISSFINATCADGNRPQAAENHVLVLNGRTVSLVQPEVLSGEARLQMEQARTAFVETLSRQFGPEVAELAMRQAATRPLTLRSVMSVVNIASMTQNIRTALSAKALSFPPAVDVRTTLNAVRFAAGGAKAAAMRAEIEELAALSEKTFEKLVHRNNGKDLGKALLAGKGKVYEAYEAHCDALTVLSAKLRTYVEFCQDQEGRLFKDGVASTDMAPLGALQERIDHALGTLSRTAAALTEAAQRGDKTFNGSRLRALLSPAAANGAAPAQARTPAQIALALGGLFEEIDRVDAGSATRADVHALRERIGDALVHILGGGTTGDVNRLALRQFAWQLADADGRLKQLEKALAKSEHARTGNAQVAQALQDGETIRKVMNGETSVGYLVDMKSLGLADKMLDPLFDEKNLQGKLRPLGSGNMNTVSIGTFKDPATGHQAKAVVKMATPADESLPRMGARNIVFDHPSPEQAKSLQRNAGVKIASRFIKCGGVVTTASATSIKGRLAIVQELAPGKSPREWNEALSPKKNPHERNKVADAEARKLSCGVDLADLLDGRLDRTTELTAAQKTRLYGQILEQTNRLMMSDYLTGQLDRHNGNFMFDVEGDLKNGSLDFQVTIKGIDNDCSFPVGRIGLEKFKLTADAIQDMENGRPNWQNPLPGFGDLHASRLAQGNPPAVTFNDDGSVTVDLAQMSAADRGLFFDIFGINNMAKPSFVLRDTYEAMTAPGARERFANEMAGTVGPAELEAALARFDEMVAYFQTLANANPSRVIDVEELRTSSDLQFDVAEGERSNLPQTRDARKESNRIVSMPYVQVLLHNQSCGVIDMVLRRQFEAARNNMQPAGAPQPQPAPAAVVPQPAPAAEEPQAPVERPLPPRPPRRAQAAILQPLPNVPKGEDVHPAITEATRANFRRNASKLGERFAALAQDATAFSDVLSPFVRESARRGEILPEVAAYAKLMDDVKALLTAAPTDPAALQARIRELMTAAKAIDMGPVKKFIATVRRFSPLAERVDALRQASGMEKVQRLLTLAEINHTLEEAGLGHLVNKIDRYRLIELGGALDKLGDLFFDPADVVERCGELLDDALVIEKPRTQAMDALEQVFGSVQGREMIVAALKERLPAGATFAEAQLDEFFRSVKPGDYVTGMNELLVDVLEDAVGAGLVTEAGALTDKRVKPVFKAFAELAAARLEGLVEKGRIVPAGYSRAAHLELLVDTGFPRAGALFKSTVHALLANDPEHAFTLVRQLARSPMVSNDVVQFLLNLRDPEERLGILDRMAAFGHSGSVQFAKALHVKWQALQIAEQANGGPLTRSATLKILLPFLSGTVDEMAAKIEEKPQDAFDAVLQTGAMNFAATQAAANPTAYISAAQMYLTLVPLGRTPNDVVALMNGGAFDPAAFDPSLYSVGTAVQNCGVDYVKTLFARDFHGMKPVLRLTLPDGGANGGPQTLVLNEHEKVLSGEITGPEPSETTNAFVDAIYRLCGGHDLQAMNVVMSFTQNCDTDALATNICLNSPMVCTFTRHDISFDSATGDVVVRRMTDPKAPVTYSMTRVFHADGTQEVTAMSTFARNEAYDPTIPADKRAPTVS